MQNSLLSLLDIDYPLIQAPMAGVSTPALAAAVSNAGALGSLGLGAATVAQAEALDAVFVTLQTVLDGVINLDVPAEVVVKRLSGRRTCRSCGSLYHLTHNPPQRENVCNSCGGELYQRDDDNETTIRQRLAVYQKQTFPLIEYYGKQNLVKTIPGEGTPDEVFASICQILG